MKGTRTQLEQRIRTHCTRGETGRAVELALQGYGLEFKRLLNSILRDPEGANEAYSIFIEALLTDLPGFRWESSFRTWSYQVARHIAYRLESSPAAREILVSQDALEQEVSPERSQTLPWLRTEFKERFRALRSRLEPHHQRILTLRVEQGLPWRDVAQALAPPGEPLSSEALARKVVVLRQQFQHIKVRLRQLAREEAFLSSEPLLD